MVRYADDFVILCRTEVAATQGLAIVQHWPRKKSLDKLKDTLRGKTPRNSGQSLHCVIANVNQTLVGWFGYFSNTAVRGSSAGSTVGCEVDCGPCCVATTINAVWLVVRTSNAGRIASLPIRGCSVWQRDHASVVQSSRR